MSKKQTLQVRVNDFPEDYGVPRDTYAYFPVNTTGIPFVNGGIDYAILVPEEKHRMPEPFNTFSILHEQGHASLNHPIELPLLPDDVILACEVDAWIWARGCIKEEYHQMFEQFASYNLSSYKFKREPKVLEALYIEMQMFMEVNKIRRK